MNSKKKIVLSGDFENVVEINDHYYIISKKNRVAVLPYIISNKGLLSSIGVIKDYNYINEQYNYTLINGYINQDDGTNLVAANRVLYHYTKLDISSADNWMFLGSVYNNLTSDSPIELYCVNVSNKNLIVDENDSNDSSFRIVDSSYVITSNDTLLLSSYLRLWNYFYTDSLK